MDKLDIIDIHSHILPEVDDGSSNMEETMQMLRMAREQGIKTMIATPHCGAGYNECSVLELKERKQRVEEQLSDAALDIQLYLGHELYYRETLLREVMEGKALTLAESRYVLVEFALEIKYKSLYQGMREFILAGYAPVIAHVERYRCLTEQEERIEELIELGCYIQMNSSSLLGSMFSKRLAQHKRFIKNRWIHFIGTDCHNSKSRAPIMERALETVIKLTDIEYASEIFYKNQAKILENKYI